MTDKDPESPRPGAVALHYDEVNAPRVTAKGEDELARQIIALAREHNVPLYENAELLDLLSRIETGDEIPEALYHVIAEVIAFAYRLRGQFPAGWDASGQDGDSR